MLLSHLAEVKERITHSSQTRIDAHIGTLSNFLERHFLIITHINHLALWSRQKVYQFLHITKHLFAYNLLLSSVCLEFFAAQTGKIIVVPLFNHAEHTLTAITVDDDIMRYTH